MPLNLDKHKLTQTFTNYVAYCKRSPWLTVREAYKFKFGRWLYSKVDFDKQTDEEILQICLDSQEQYYDNEDNEKGINFITQALRFNDTVISIDDIKLIRSLKNGETLHDKALKDSPLSYPKFSCWVGTLLPETYKIYGTDLIGGINYLYNTADIPTRGANSYRLVNEYLNDLAVNLKTDFDKEIQELINLIFPESETLVPCDLVWLVHDYIMFLDRRVFNYQPSYYWINDQSKSDDDNSVLKASLENSHHQKRLKNLKEGDIVVHYFDKHIQAISTVIEEYNIAYDAKGNSNLTVQAKVIDRPSITLTQVKKLLRINNNELIKRNYPFNKNFEVENGYCFDFNKASFELIFGETPTQNTHSTMEKTVQPLNQILYGPPGTGKTYVTRQMAVAIANPVFNFSDDIELNEEYNRLVKEGQIKFTTFHQSMGYEDFMEGIKPKMNDDDEGDVRYEIQDGIFKLICNKAIKSKKTIQKPEETVAQIEPFDLAWNQLIEYVTEQLANEETPKFSTLTNKNIDVRAITDKGNLLVKPSIGGELEYIVSYTRAKKLFNAFPQLNEVKNIDKEFRSVIGGSNSTAYWSILNYLHGWINDNQNLVIESSLQEFEDEAKNYVLIIDEINRGNVSAIFGELITLLEDTKRLGSKEELKVILPYSKTEFGVPANVYIIGTMNTADRSVEALDTALRRRFSFTEMMPDATLLSAIQFGAFSLAEILETINQRVAILLDRDHTIGHSYFMQLQNEDYNGLKEVFVNKIIPLLQEYFYNDYKKIAMVLGEGFVEVATTKVAFAYKPSGDYGTDSNITLKKSADIAIESAIQLLMNVKPSE